MDRRVKFLQSAAKSVSPPRLLSQSSAWGESSEPCRTSSTDRRVVALPHPRWQGTTERFAPLISRWCRPPVVTLPNPQPGSRARGARRGGQNPRSGHGWNIATTHLDLLRPNLRVAPAGITSSLACLNWSVALEPALSLFVGSTAKAVATDPDSALASPSSRVTTRNRPSGEQGCRHAGQAPTRRDPGPRSAGVATGPGSGLPRDPEAAGADDAVPRASRTRTDAGAADEARHRTARPSERREHREPARQRTRSLNHPEPPGAAEPRGKESTGGPDRCLAHARASESFDPGRARRDSRPGRPMRGSRHLPGQPYGVEGIDLPRSRDGRGRL